MTTAAAPGVVEAIDAALPQTQCTRCGYPDCRAYAEAIADGSAGINRCPPGGAEGVARLSALTGRPPLPLDPDCGAEGPLRLALIDEAWCIGCTLCITACPVDCIVGSNKRMHTVISAQCTGCELCVPACPVDCISMVAVDAGSDAPTGWAAWGPQQASDARRRYRATTARRARARTEHDERLAAKAAAKLADLATASTLTDPSALDRKRALVEAAMARARARRDES
ncbi:electron transport complex subunit RsxB [Rivibacter subsaxonicus]|uniref:Electron transport complex protein RnfB n=1 Tax=Rivibacter subsaxonicus TaxID=457575 RepID=A0A4Q7VMU9_9BURK|nr:electron transport complex subunit RsxB [Rivibacter subsaxonicus]RZT97660.1 electron transport complex protein RnfB [Rivibacter subsaxonicus]